MSAEPVNAFDDYLSKVVAQAMLTQVLGLPADDDVLERVKAACDGDLDRGALLCMVMVEDLKRPRGSS